jgi:undecaprenyl-phosphate 4-deoxy-4-formamido-L-arabinose transferase
MAFGMLLLVYVLVRYVIEGGSIPGFPFLASTITLFSGVQLFMIGVFGEYLARMHIRSMGRPFGVVRDRVGWPDQLAGD